MFDQRLVLGRRGDLHHLEPGRRLQYPVADLGRLQHAVALPQRERRALVLVDHPHPAPVAEDHLEPDPMEVHVVRDGAAVRDGDVRGDEAAALAIGQQIAVAHAGTAHHPRRCLAGPVHGERRPARREDDRWVGRAQLDAGAVRGDDRPLAAHHRLSVQQAQVTRIAGVVPSQLDPRPVTFEDRGAGVVGGGDRRQAEPQRSHEVLHRLVQVDAGKDHQRRGDLTRVQLDHADSARTASASVAW